jgi:putative transposase
MAEGHEQRKVHNLIRIVKKLKKSHIVMENLNIQGCKTKAKHKSGDNYNDVAKVLHINDYKNEVKKQANKKDIMVSLVDAHYTSQTCSECGHISKQNRESQETFSCKHCGFTINADTNAAINIKNRITVEGLRKSLERYNSDDKMYEEIPYRRKNIYQSIYGKIYGY